MKVKKLLISLIIFFIVLFVKNISNAMQHYQTVGTTTGIVTASGLNIRQGPGTSFKIVAMVYKNQYVRVFAQIGSWYVIQTENDYIGMASTKYIKLIYPTGGASDINKNTETITPATTSALTTDELEVFNLINQKRTATRIVCVKNR